MDWHLVILGLGLVGQTMLFLFGIYRVIIRNDLSNKALKDDIVEMKNDLHKLTEVIVTQAVQTTEIKNLTSQLTMLQRNVEDLRRGNGFVRGRGGVDGEYPK